VNTGRRDLEEALHQRAEFGWTHAGGELRRAAHIGIQHRNLDLCAAAFLGQYRFAQLAEMRIAPPRRAAHQTHRRCGETVEPRAAQAAAIPGGG